MADRKLSKRSRRRLRQTVARRLAGQGHKEPRRAIQMEVDRPGPYLPPELPPSSSTPEFRGSPSSTEPLAEPCASFASAEVCDSSSTSSEPSGSSPVSLAASSVSPEAEPSRKSSISSENSASDSLASLSDGISFSDEGSATAYASASSCPLYPSSCITDDTFNTVFLSLVQRHNLTYACQSDILKLLLILLPSPSNLPCSSRMLISNFVNFAEDTIVQHYCGSCTQPINSGTTCTKQHCIQAQLQRAAFIRIPLHMQLRERFKDPEFVHLLEYRFHREKKLGYLSDIYDGAEYAKYAEFFESPYNVSFALNFDGAPKFKSSSVQIWPIMLHINELPPHIRGSRQHMFLGGIWCSSKKPPTTECLSSIIEEIQSLATDGIRVILRGEEVICRARLLYTLADLPAKASLMNMTQFNGRFGCPTCMQEGKQVAIGRGRTRAYGYHPSCLRSHRKYLKHAVQAEETNQAVYGIKGKSVLLNLPDFDMIENNPVDYMHCVLLGVVRSFVSLWFDSKNHKEPWYIGNKLREAECRLSSVKPPTSVTRTPRYFRGRGWKATESRTFLLYYLPLLCGILPDKYLAHVFLLSKAIRLLLADQLSPADIDIAENLLHLFWRLTEKYYGLKHCKMNVHLLAHLPHFVRQFGPLWTHSAFAFEDSIGHLVKKAHGTHDIAHQIVTSFLLQWRLHVQRKTLQGPENLKAFSDGLQIKSKLKKKIISESAAGLGVPKNILLEEEDMYILTQFLEKNNTDMSPHGMATVYPKLQLRDCILHSQDFTRSTKRNDFTVSFVNPESPHSVCFGRIRKFLSYPADSNDSIHVAIIQQVEVRQCMEQSLTFPPEIQSLSPLLCSDFFTYFAGEHIAIPIDHILSKCFDISSLGSAIITPMVCKSEVLK